MDNVLEINGLNKRFGSKQVLNGVTLSVPENCVFGFVGRNGAGKTTTMKSVIGLLKPDGGEITVCGRRVAYGGAKTNRFIGYLPDVPEFYGYMTAREYMSLCKAPHQGLFARHEAAPRHSAGAHQPSQAAHMRRTHFRP